MMADTDDAPIYEQHALTIVVTGLVLLAAYYVVTDYRAIGAQLAAAVLR